MSMPKPLKYTLFSAGGLLLILVLLVAGIIVFVDPNDYRDRIEQAASQQIGRPVHITGQMSLSFFPWAGLEIEGVTVANAQGFQPQNMLAVRRAGLKVKLLPLLSREVQVGTLLLDGCAIHLAKDAKGRTNWQDLLLAQPSPSSTEKPAPQPAGKKKTSTATPAALSIEKVTITDTVLTWNDRTSGTRTEVRDLDVDLGPVSLNSPFPFDLSFDIDNAQPAVKAQVTCQGRIQADLTGQTVHIRDLDLKTTAKGAALPSGSATAEIQTAMSLNWGNGSLQIPQLQLSTYDLQISGQAEGTTLFTAPALSGRLQLAAFNPKELLQAMGLPAVQTTDPKALTSVQASTSFAAQPAAVELSSLNLHLDDTTLTGKATVKLTGNVPASTFQLQADAIDVDRYLPPPSSQAKERKQQTGQAPANKQKAGQPAQGGLPVNTLRSLDLNGQVDVGKLSVKGMQMEDITLKVEAKDGRLSLSPLQGGLYGGLLRSSARLDARGQTPDIHLQAGLSDVHMESLLGAGLGTKILSGLGSIQTDLTTKGLDARSMLQTLGGTLDLKLNNGSFRGADLLQRIRSTVLALKGQELPQAEDQSTEFSSLTLHADIKDGIIRKSDLRLMSALFDVQGSGQLNLLQKSLDYMLNLTFHKDVSTRYPELSFLEGKQVPLNLQGSVSDPRLAVNEQTLARILGQEALSGQIDKGVKKLQEKLGLPESNQTAPKDQQPVQDVLKGLFGNQPSN